MFLISSSIPTHILLSTRAYLDFDLQALNIRIPSTIPGSPPTMAAEIKQATKETFHFINDPADAINEAAIGLTEYNANLSYSPTHKIVYRSDLDAFRKDHVTTIGFAGGGQ